MITAFENFLLTKGYEPFTIDFKAKKITRVGEHYSYSSVGIVSVLFFKKGTEVFDKAQNNKFEEITTKEVQQAISFGLGELRLPPTLLHPRPRICVMRKKNNRVVEGGEDSDANMIHIIDNFPFEVIFDAMFDRTKVLVSDLTGENVLTSKLKLGVKSEDNLILNPNQV